MAPRIVTYNVEITPRYEEEVVRFEHKVKLAHEEKTAWIHKLPVAKEAVSNLKAQADGSSAKCQIVNLARDVGSELQIMLQLVNSGDGTKAFSFEYDVRWQDCFMGRSPSYNYSDQFSLEQPARVYRIAWRLTPEISVTEYRPLQEVAVRDREITWTYLNYSPKKKRYLSIRVSIDVSAPLVAASTPNARHRP